MINKKITLKEALIPIYTLKNVNLIYPKKILNSLITLSEEDLKEVWETSNAGVLYESMKKYLENPKEENEKNIEKITENIKNVNVKVFKNFNKEDGVSRRNYFYRSVYENWAISKIILENKDNLWEATKMARKKSEYPKKECDTKSYGYLLAHNNLNSYLGLRGKNKIDETKPFVYWNWSWAYGKYVKHSLGILKENNVVKIDLKSAFDNMTKPHYDSKIMEMLNMINKKRASIQAVNIKV